MYNTCPQYCKKVRLEYVMYILRSISFCNVLCMVLILQYYVTCNIGVAMVGYMVLCSGLSQSLSSFLAGAFNKYTGRQPLFLLSILGNAAAIVTLFLWQPSSGDTVAIFVLVAVGSMVFSIANTVISGT